MPTNFYTAAQATATPAGFSAPSPLCEFQLPIEFALSKENGQYSEDGNEVRKRNVFEQFVRGGTAKTN